MEPNPLIGTWELIAWELRDEEGRVSYPFGPDAVGFLTYTDDGHMSVIITAGRRPAFAASDLLGGTRDEKAAAAESCVAYCGRYRIDGDRVIIQVDARLFPNWVGTGQERTFELEDGRLSMHIAPSTWSGRRQAARLVWGR